MSELVSNSGQSREELLAKFNSTELAWAATEAAGMDPNAIPPGNIRGVIDGLARARQDEGVQQAQRDEAFRVSVELAKRLLVGTGLQMAPEQGQQNV